MLCIFRLMQSLPELPLYRCSQSLWLNLISTLIKFIKVFSSKGGITGRKIRNIMAVAAKRDNIDLRRECVLKSLCVYLNEDMGNVVKEYLNGNPNDAEREIEQTVMGIYVIRREGEDDTEEAEDVGVVLEGVEVLNELKNIVSAFIMLFGLIYALNLSYPHDLKFTFEVLQKVIMNMDGQSFLQKCKHLKLKCFSDHHKHNEDIFFCILIFFFFFYKLEMVKQRGRTFWFPLKVFLLCSFLPLTIEGHF
ncbi:uncharacterized protein LOC114646060 isoform X1 [Erpetoichthys calabaricus]|uniref:uncharacterized protein LOC114646060 isoform X1 n=1 Tax=Erpetoichthys calabaricus TaxID=27687 RepID=UPI0022343906|nr:uncharacterized protein LOC114646060 isoform X1 [Erpetoichthys calabaricus]